MHVLFEKDKVSAMVLAEETTPDTIMGAIFSHMHGTRPKHKFVVASDGMSTAKVLSISDYGESLIKTVRLLRDHGLGLKESKEIAEGEITLVGNDDEIDSIADGLNELGARINIKEADPVNNDVRRIVTDILNGVVDFENACDLGVRLIHAVRKLHYRAVYKRMD
jgi:ribosomal protein L7/L12